MDNGQHEEDTMDDNMAATATAIWFDGVEYNRDTGEVTIGAGTRIEVEALDYDSPEEAAKIEEAVTEAIHDRIVKYGAWR